MYLQSTVLVLEKVKIFEVNIFLFGIEILPTKNKTQKKMSRKWKNLKHFFATQRIPKINHFPRVLFSENMRKTHNEMKNATKTQLFKWIMGFLFSKYKRNN